MKHVFAMSAVVSAVFALSLSLFAQPNVSQGLNGSILSPTGNVDVNAITRNNELCKMLGLTAKQMEALRGINEKFRQMSSASNQGSGARFNSSDNAESQQRASAMWTNVNEVLNAEQRTMFKEVAFQLSGGLYASRLNEQMLDVLELSNNQRDTIRELTAKQGTETRNANENNVGSQEQRRIANEERNVKYAEQIRAILTAEQKAKAERLTAQVPVMREKLGVSSSLYLGQGPESRGQMWRLGRGPVFNNSNNGNNNTPVTDSLRQRWSPRNNNNNVNNQ
jgi:Spy/CpxP family protein refolding chaperone